MPTTVTFDTSQLLDLLRIVLTVVAGLGGVVLLAVNTRKQRVTEADHRLAVERAERERVQGFNERFGAAAEQLAHESPGVRLAGVFAMAGLADDWTDQSQVCVDVLCGNLRVLADGDTQVREAIMRVVRDRLGAGDWNHLDFDFTSLNLDDADFSGLRFDGKVTFDGVRFEGELTSFRRTVFAGTLSCHGTSFEAKTTTFAGARFRNAAVEFVGARFGGAVLELPGATLSGRAIDFYRCEFEVDRVDCSQLMVLAGNLRFDGCVFTGTTLDFSLLNDIFPLAEKVLARLTIEDSRLVRCVLDMRWSGRQPHLWWLVDSRLDHVEFRVGDPLEEPGPWLNVRGLELIATELPARYVRPRKS